MEKRYTLADLEEALRRDSDSDRHSNPGRTRRNFRRDQHNVSLIRDALIRQGDLPDPAQSPEVIERRRIESALEALHPNAESRLEVEFEGQSYRRRYSKISGVWYGRWEKLSS
jgi:hypothetical protein